MNKSTLYNEILGVCKYCTSFFENKKLKNRHQCFTHKCSIYDVKECRRTHHVRKKWEKKQSN